MKSIVSATLSLINACRQLGRFDWRASSVRHCRQAVILVVLMSLTTSARGQDYVYAVEFNQSDNLFGTLDLLTGNFNQISDLGGTVYNDIAYDPTNGALYGIENSADLVMFNATNGAVTDIAPFNVSGIESLAFQPGTGILYGCSQETLYTINPATAEATLVGNFGAPYNLNMAQNIRFDSDGNLYLSNTSTNTDVYQVNPQTGNATFVGEATGYANMMLMNAGQYMFGVSIPAINSAASQWELLSFDVASFVSGGTNADGSIHPISVTLVGGGPAFPVNFIFSGGVPAVIPPPWGPQLAIARTADGPAQLTASGGFSGMIYVFECSTDLVSWNSIATNAADTNGCAVLIAGNATNRPIGYYRTLTPQP
jgi:hypothetical protein